MQHWDVHRFEEIDSTNRYLLDEAAAGAEPGLVAVTKYQTAGRGRMDRKWETKPGDALMFSVLLPPSVAETALRAFALSVADALPFDLGLKWPNDVLVGDKKLAGILAESVTTGGKLTALVVGCGLNLRSVPLALEGRATFADEWTESPTDPTDLLGSILGSLHDWLDRPSDVVAEFRARCVTIGRQVSVESPVGKVEGTAIDVADNGALLVRDGSGLIRQVTIGDALHLAVGPTN